MKVLLKKEVCGSHKQCTGPTGNTPQPKKTHLKNKKEKRKEEENTYARHCLFISTQTDSYFRMWTSPKEKIDMQKGIQFLRLNYNQIQ